MEVSVNVKKCDRCKSYYDGNEKYRTVGEYLKVRVTHIKICDPYGNVGEKIDLCDNCMDELMCFLHIEDNTEKEKDIEKNE